MKLLYSIGDVNHSSYTSRKQVLSCADELSFDGVYESVYQNQDVLKGKSGIFFVIGAYTGLENISNNPYVPKIEKYCTWSQIIEMANKWDFQLGWHTWTHPDLTRLTKAEIIQEITPPKQYRMPYLAYPHGKFNDLVIECAKEVGFNAAYSINQGAVDINAADFNYKRFREYITI